MNMRILWITNIPLPPICKEMDWEITPIGGWMYSSLKRLSQYSDISLGVASIYQGSELIHKTLSDGIDYYLIPLNGGKKTTYSEKLENIWREVRNLFKPDVVHIHGSEYPHALAYVNGCGKDGVVVSIQGLVSVYSRYHNIPIEERKYFSIRDIIKGGGIQKGRLMLEQTGKYEKKLLKKVTHVIGRTDWDKSHTWAINPLINYHFCGENLRDIFYQKIWRYSKCTPYTIFVSQGNYPIKGLHQLLKAMPLVLRKYPDSKIIVAGNDEVSKPWWKITEYGKYLSSLIKDNHLESSIRFTGMISEEEMCSCFLDANVFVCCSAIENSSNSLGEAQLLEMPYLASFVGGSPEIVGMNEEVLYRYEEYEMLAKKIIDIFDQKENYSPVPCNLSRYDRDLNTNQLVNVYKFITEKNNISNESNIK